MQKKQWAKGKTTRTLPTANSGVQTSYSSTQYQDFLSWHLLPILNSSTVRIPNKIHSRVSFYMPFLKILTKIDEISEVNIYYIRNYW